MSEMWRYLVDVVRERRAEETLQRHNTAVEEMEERILELRETVSAAMLSYPWLGEDGGSEVATGEDGQAEAHDACRDGASV